MFGTGGDGDEVVGDVAADVVRSFSEDIPFDIRRASALRVAWNASDAVVIVERHMISQIGFLNPLLYRPTVMYYGSSTSARLLRVWNSLNSQPQTCILKKNQ